MALNLNIKKFWNSESSDEKTYWNLNLNRLQCSPHRPEPQKTAFVVVFFILAILSNCATTAYIHDIVPREPLPDVIFTLIPQQSWALKFGDLMAGFCLFLMVLLVMFHKHGQIVFRRVMFIFGVLYWLRSLCIFCTQLPPGYDDASVLCLKQLTPEERTWEAFLSRMLGMGAHVGLQTIDEKVLCGDLLFSGHTLVMIISILTFKYYLPENFKYLRFIPQFLSMIGITCLVISRTHYTVDVVFAVLLSFLVFTLYHAYCEIIDHRQRQNWILNEWKLSEIIFWLETNVTPGKIENCFEMPFKTSSFNLLGQKSAQNDLMDLALATDPHKFT
uniref:Sphingomyelin synthase-like domain-containing protein n=2 Tax=Panagrolaimus sp. JU765 TaxID=591449 RepID=A0AC34QZG3_9BILA